MIDYQALLTRARKLDAKPEKSHSMEVVVSRCGTASCAVGDMALENGDWDERIVYDAASQKHGPLGLGQWWDPDNPTDATYGNYASAKLGIKKYEAGFLFGAIWICRSSPTPTTGVKLRKFLDRSQEKPKQTAARIRKFVYYKLRKAEIFAEYNEGLQKGINLYQHEGRVDKDVLTQV